MSPSRFGSEILQSIPRHQESEPIPPVSVVLASRTLVRKNYGLNLCEKMWFFREDDDI